MWKRFPIRLFRKFGQFNLSFYYLEFWTINTKMAQGVLLVWERETQTYVCCQGREEYFQLFGVQAGRSLKICQAIFFVNVINVILDSDWSVTGGVHGSVFPGGRATSWRRGKMDNAYFSQLLGMASEKQKAKTATSRSSSKFISTKVWPHILFIYVLTAFLYYWRCLSVFIVPP